MREEAPGYPAQPSERRAESWGSVARLNSRRARRQRTGCRIGLNCRYGAGPIGRGRRRNVHVRHHRPPPTHGESPEPRLTARGRPKPWPSREREQLASVQAWRVYVYVRSYGARCNMRRFIMSISGDSRTWPIAEEVTLYADRRNVNKALFHPPTPGAPRRAPSRARPQPQAKPQVLFHPLTPSAPKHAPSRRGTLRISTRENDAG
jgi:hypothetical protein